MNVCNQSLMRTLSGSLATGSEPMVPFGRAGKGITLKAAEKLASGTGWVQAGMS